MKQDKSPYVAQNKKREMTIPIAEKIPWTAKQKKFISKMQSKSNKVTFLVGPAGTSKTCLAVYVALQALKEKKYSDIIYIRSVVESASAKMGFLPGDMGEKLSPYAAPLNDKLEEFLGESGLKRFNEGNFCSVRPVNYLRGSHFAGKFVILDEAQNLTKAELITVLTRIGEFSKVIICGDINQSDIGSKSCLGDFKSMFNDLDSQDMGIDVLEFESEDIVRSEIVKYIVSKIEKSGI